MFFVFALLLTDTFYYSNNDEDVYFDPAKTEL